MTADERAIRELIAAWISASRAGDLDTVLGLMTDDVVFMVPGTEPFGRAAFAAAAMKMKGTSFEGTGEVRELQVLGDWAFVRSYLEVAMTRRAARQSAARAGCCPSCVRAATAAGAWRATPTCWPRLEPAQPPPSWRKPCSAWTGEVVARRWPSERVRGYDLDMAHAPHPAVVLRTSSRPLPLGEVREVVSW